jgi:hypothetical protein
MIPRVLASCAAALLAGCATAGVDDLGDAALADATAAPGPDAAVADATALDAALADAAAPDAAAPDAAPGPDACTPQWIGLLLDGGFDGDLADTAWTQGGGTLIRQSDLPLFPHTAPGAARMLGANNAAQLLAQTVSVPAGASALRLRGYGCFVTEEEPGAGPVDTVAIELRDPGGAVLHTLTSLSNEDAGAQCNWEPFEHVAPEPLAGEQVALALAGSSDAARFTTLWFDTLTLEALVDCP